MALSVAAEYLEGSEGVSTPTLLIEGGWANPSLRDESEVHTTEIQLNFDLLPGGC